MNAAWELHLELVEERKRSRAKDARIRQLERKLALAEKRLLRIQMEQKGWR